MNEREEHIIEAAKNLFIRYGVKRTGMSDIAEEAGISRQTLYNAFSSKDAVLQAMIRLLAEKVVLEIEAGLKETKTLGDQLNVIFNHIAIEHYDLLQSSPNAEDIVAGVNASSQEELEAGARRNTEIICRILEPYTAEIERHGLTIHQFADFIQRSATAAKYNATNKKHLLGLLSALRVSVLTVTNSA